MIIGAMNHPAENPVTEISWMAEMKLDFLDLTLEPPGASVGIIKPAEIRRALADHGLGVIGHTAYYLPIGSPFEELRRASVEQFKRCLGAFGEIGARWMNIHPDGHAPFQDLDFINARNIQSLQELLPVARQCGVGLMIENLPGKFNSVRQLAPILDAVAECGLHLDLGHCNLLTEKNTCDELMAKYGDRLRHVHFHDNKGGYADLHLPLGAGNIDFPHYVRLLKKNGYDGTITLEVFSADRHYLAHSRDTLRRLWVAA